MVVKANNYNARLYTGWPIDKCFDFQKKKKG